MLAGLLDRSEYSRVKSVQDVWEVGQELEFVPADLVLTLREAV